MSSPGKNENVGGHPPAVKAGGMRIVQNKSHLKSREPTIPKPEEEALKVDSSPPKSSSLTVSGAPIKGNADFPEKAVQSFHDKPVPTHDRGAVSKPVIIHQPKK